MPEKPSREPLVWIDCEVGTFLMHIPRYII
jgi:hypothetical protein